MTAPSRQWSAFATAIAAAVFALPLAVPATVPCPEGMSRIADVFCIDRYEGSLVQIGEDGSEQPHSPYHSPERLRVRARSQRGVVPQGHISQVQAERACRAAGKRLCSNTEWLRACRGTRGTTFPYGATREAGRCNENHTRHPVVQLFGRSRGPLWTSAHMNDPQLNQLPGTVARTGAFAGCTNEFGVFDMVGNLHEWTSDPAGTFRGGYYMDTRQNGDGCLYTTRAHDVSYRDYSTGFRCCADLPES
jgi:formylglycine-generating enzyme required for sulfatase activity